jgi:hypothetical protein
VREAENNQLCVNEEVERWRYHSGNSMKEELEITKIEVKITWIRTRYRFNLNELLSIKYITRYTRVLKTLKWVKLKINQTK